MKSSSSKWCSIRLLLLLSISPEECINTSWKEVLLLGSQVVPSYKPAPLLQVHHRRIRLVPGLQRLVSPIRGALEGDRGRGRRHSRSLLAPGSAYAEEKQQRQERHERSTPDWASRV
ncbi:hypothetical protein BO71DRAFT_101590 [Aspergillus ellipticus CBS 707.79]|uniref:Secreted protein n=1 Tax=Aspergillus ellipticus CBS 707.79 TaxID=1448320 RepID=A0A319DM42_9EURO|nr:hypothetical protein BO71DRAFT_101590 [Aspergillus ellipticus CBS 707.79]